jgi:serine/threonine protein kinase
VLGKNVTSFGFNKGDVVAGKYRIQGVIGEGGFGIVYLAIQNDTDALCAIKTFPCERLADTKAREDFQREILLWVRLEEYPFILKANWVVNSLEGFFVEMEYIGPDPEGRVTLEDHLTRASRRLEIATVLKWSLQFCFGMEHAAEHGISSHRDIKPANILITKDGLLKIGDFGLAQAAQAASDAAAGLSQRQASERIDRPGLSVVHTQGRVICGTPGYIPPEICRGGPADARSDIYSFGLVLWQMAATKPIPPFSAPWRGDVEEYLLKVYEQQVAGAVPPTNTLLDGIIHKCLRPDPAARFASFSALRDALEPLFSKDSASQLEIPKASPKDEVFWARKGAMLGEIQQYGEAHKCCDRALAMHPEYWYAWLIKSRMFVDAGRYETAIKCFDKVLSLNPGNVFALSGQGQALFALGLYEEAVQMYDAALEVNPNRFSAWSGKGASLVYLNRNEEAAICFKNALTIAPNNSLVWYNLARSEDDLGRWTDAIRSYERFLEVASPLEGEEIHDAKNRLKELRQRRGGGSN